jgi:ketosteroid isomerase-like protein
MTQWSAGALAGTLLTSAVPSRAYVAVEVFMSDNVSKLQQMYAAFGRGDINTILENVTDDVTWGTETVVSEVPWYRVRSGREGVGDFFATLAREVDFPRFEPTIFAPVGDQVLVRLDYDYIFKKNGKGATTGAVHQFTLRDGKVSSFRAFEDTAAVRQAWNA